MSYFAPYVDASGYHYPTYPDIVDELVTKFQSIYGTGIYLGSDSQDYEIISAFALKIYESYQAIELAYNAHSPVTSIGTGLDYIVAINGLARRQGTASTAVLTLTGTPGMIINNGVVSDISGYMWDLPETVTIDSDGTANAIATCRETGTVIAESGAINRIMTPTMGWISVTNLSAATTGTVTETDSSLRTRQALSVANVSSTILAGLKGALLALDVVNGCEVLENDTNTTQSGTSLPAHSICAVVDFEDDGEHKNRAKIAEIILNKKSCGCATYGDITQSVTDTTGQVYSINFKQMSRVDVYVDVVLTPLANYSRSYVTEVQTALVNYLNTFDAGATVPIQMLNTVALAVNPDLSNPAFTISSLLAGKSTADDTEDITFDFYEVAHGNAVKITVTDGLN